jgi:putative colanic acid biosynthesis UDP-glucose lipid carrier transferase
MIISILGFYLFEYQIYNISYFKYLIVGWIVVAVFIHFTMSIVLQHLLKFFKIVKQSSVSLIVIAFFSVFKTICF